MEDEQEECSTGVALATGEDEQMVEEKAVEKATPLVEQQSGKAAESGSDASDEESEEEPWNSQATGPHRRTASRHGSGQGTRLPDSVQMESLLRQSSKETLQSDSMMQKSTAVLEATEAAVIADVDLAGAAPIAAFDHTDSRAWTIRWETGQTARVKLQNGTYTLFGRNYQLQATEPVSFIWPCGTLQTVESWDGSIVTWTTTKPSCKRISWELEEVDSDNESGDTLGEEYRRPRRYSDPSENTSSGPWLPLQSKSSGSFGRASGGWGKMGTTMSAGAASFSMPKPGRRLHRMRTVTRGESFMAKHDSISSWPRQSNPEAPDRERLLALEKELRQSSDEGGSFGRQRGRSEGTPSSIGRDSIGAAGISSPGHHESGAYTTPGPPGLESLHGCLSFSSQRSRTRADRASGSSASLLEVNVMRLRKVFGQLLENRGHDYRHFRAAVRANSLCALILDREVQELAQHAELFNFIGGDEVIVRGSRSTHFFVVKEGHLSMGIDPNSVEVPAIIGVGDSFGEMAIVHNIPQPLSITVATTENGDGGALCWGVEQDVFRRVLMGLTERVHQENIALFDQVRIFRYLDRQQKASIARSSAVHIFEKGKYLTRQGSPYTDCMFVVKQGTLGVEVGGKQVSRLVDGEYCCERAWLYQEPRAADVISLDHSAVVVVRRKILEQVVGEAALKDVLYRNVIHLSLRERFAGRRLPSLGRCDLETVTDAFIIQDYGPKSSIIDEERHESVRQLTDRQRRKSRNIDPADVQQAKRGIRFIVVLRGRVDVSGPDGEQCLGRGECFGEEYLIDTSKRFRHRIQNNSDEPCELAILSTDAVSALSTTGEEVMTLQEKVAAVRKVAIFHHLSSHHCNLLANSFRTIIRKEGEYAVREGEMGSQFFVIKSGELIVSINGQQIRTLGKSDYFGERGLLYDEPRTATVIVHSEEAELMVIDKVIFANIVQGEMLKHLEQRIELQRADIKRADLRRICELGKGQFGIVHLVEHRSRGTQYALKCIDRQMAAQAEQGGGAWETNLLNEREILLENDHPFIIKVVKDFKGKRFTYFLTERVSGGELFEVVRQIGTLNKKQAQFYTGSMILAIESLHERNIAYRDLKPENILIDSQGFIKLIDFGVAVKLRGFCKTLCGTAHYIAPEVICAEPYKTSCDFWSMGVVMYDFMCECLPFANASEDPQEIFREILTAKVQFPAGKMPDRSSRALIRKLLRRKVDLRIGCTRPGWVAVKKHSYFRGFSFDKLLSRELEPPFVPQLQATQREKDSEADSDLDLSEEAESTFSEDSAFSSVSSASDAEGEDKKIVKNVTRVCSTLPSAGKH